MEKEINYEKQANSIKINHFLTKTKTLNKLMKKNYLKMTLLKKEPVNTITNRIHYSVEHTISFGYSVFFSSILKN